MDILLIMDIYDKSEDEFLEWLQSQINDEEEGISDTDQLDNLYTFISNRIIRRKKTHKKLLKWAFWDENLFDSNE
jgi:flagellin-specific chaperone FliS|tara:strand:- start:1727 stop:1951 length:225 start_codon:yes stop_codon:yes gene_type:complete